jgi:uncharacterized membrane protein YbhN (UPF0104 family)
MRRPPSTRTLLALLLLWGVLLGLAIIFLGLLALDGFNDIGEWSAWMQSNQTVLFIWRLFLYAATAYAWYRMRLSLKRRGLDEDQSRRLLCAEVAAITVLALLEWLAFRQN